MLLRILIIETSVWHKLIIIRVESQVLGIPQTLHQWVVIDNNCVHLYSIELIYGHTSVDIVHLVD
jgi:hypothetical protein